jgi:environmental stress-induced protein Ves
VFSDFSGYQRHLVLIAGEGIKILHDDKQIDNLVTTLDVATFDGESKTYGTLSNGAIKDFNIITNKYKIIPNVKCYADAKSLEVNLIKSNLYFAYSLTKDIEIELSNKDNKVIPQGCLVKISSEDFMKHRLEYTVNVSGESMIFITLKPTDAGSSHE